MAPITKVLVAVSTLDAKQVDTINALARGGVDVSVSSNAEKPADAAFLPAVKLVDDAEAAVSSDSTAVVVGEAGELSSKAAEAGAHVFVLGSESKENGIKHISSPLRDLLRIVPQSHNGAPGTELLVGYAFKASREVKLGDLGLLPLIPKDGVAFLPIDIDAPFEPQLPFDLVLHKGSDFAIPGTDEACIPTFSEPMQKLEQFAAQHSIPFVDPLDSLTNYVMDRKVLCEALLKLEGAETGTETRLRGGPFVEVTSLEGLDDALKAANLRLPAIIKPRVACGQDFSHRMALLLRPGGAQDLHVPLPAVATEFIDHDSAIHKVYVIGTQVFSSQRNSIPNIATILNTEDGEQLPDHINFDSLKNKFAAMFDEMRKKDPTKARLLDMVAVRAGAAWLRKNLKMHLFGFDVCVEHSTGDHVVVDINYFPSFADVAEAPGALRSALKEAAAEFKEEPDAKRQKQ